MPTFTSIKTYFFSLFLFLFIIPAKAQSWQEEIIKKTALYQAVHHQEKVFVQTDRPSYTAGEDIWFSAFLINSGNQKLNTTEKVLYVELITPDGSSVVKEIFQLNNGRTWGSISTSEKLVTGTYYFVAFTNWMRNIGSEFYYSRQIRIFSEPEYNQDTISAQPAIEKQKDSVSDENCDSLNLSVKFYPEGGNLLQGINTKVAFEALIESGQSMQTKGFIYNDLDELIAPANTLWRGKGFFTINPQAGRKYYYKNNEPNISTVEIELPIVKTSGITMAVRELNPEQQIQVIVSKAGNLPENDSVFLLGIQNGIPKTATKIDLTKNESVSIVIDKKEYLSGIVQFTLFNSNKIPFAERLFYVNNPDHLNLVIKEKTLPDSARKKTELILIANNQDGEPVEGSFAVSVTDALRVPDAFYHSPDICSYISLIADLPDESIYNPDQSDKNSSAIAIKSELLMLTNGWRRYNWENVLSDTLPVPNYFEEPGIYVHGKVSTSVKNQKIPKNTRIGMYTRGERIEFFDEKLHKDGAFTFLLNDFKSNKPAVIQTKNNNGNKKNYNLEIHTNFHKKPSDNYQNMATKHFDYSLAFPEVNNEHIASKNSVLKKESKRKVLADTFLNNTDYYIPEAVITKKEIKTPKEKITQKYGSPDYSIGKANIEQLSQEKPWYSGIMDLLTDAFPNLEYTRGGRFLIKEERRYNIFITVDGELVNYSHSNGLLHDEFGVYTLNDLLSLDPKVVTAVDLIFPDNNPAYWSLVQSAEFYKYKIDEYSTDGTSVMQNDLAALISESDRMTTMGLILAIYTQSGAGLFSNTKFKGVSNITIHGYSNIKEFYSPDYSTKESDSILSDFRNTLAWYPDIVTNAKGKAQFSFYTSDRSNNFRVEVNGISNTGKPGALLYKSQKDLFENYPPVTNNNTVLARKEVQSHKYNVLSVLLPDSTPGAFAAVNKLSANWFSYTTAGGMLFTDSLYVYDTSIIQINKPGYKDVQLTYSELIDNDIVLQPTAYSETELSAKNILRNFHKNKYKNHKYNSSYFNGAYREKLFNGEELHQVTDYGFIQKWPSLGESTLAIETQLTGGRRFQSNDFGKAILIKPHTRFTDGVPIMDPVYAKLSFLNQSIDKEYNFALKGEIVFEGRKVYHLTFDQNDAVKWALYEGELFIDAETYGLAWASWKISIKGYDYLMPDQYLSQGGDQETFQVLEEHNQITRRFNGEIWIPAFAVSTVTLTQQGTKYTISKEMAWQSITEKVNSFTIRKPENMKQVYKLTKTPDYKPDLWRKGWLLPPCRAIDEQIIYLNNVVEFKP